MRSTSARSGGVITTGGASVYPVDAAGLMNRVGSARCRALLHDLLETLTGHRAPCVHELREQATPILSTQDR